MKILFIILVLLMVAAVVTYFMVLILMRRMLRAGARIAIEMAWKKVRSHENPILKVVEADKVLDEALRLLGYSGSLGEKLKTAGPRFRNLNGLWAAHKLRNRLVHELSAQPADHEVDEAISAFHKALTDLGARL
jgi:hypothetical protein